MKRCFATHDNLSKLVLGNLVICDPEGDPVDLNNLVPGTIYTIMNDDDPLDENMKSPENKLRRERTRLARTELIQQLYVPKHPDLFRLSDSMLVPSFLEAFHSGNLRSGNFDSIIRKETDTWVYSFDLLADDYCKRFLEEVDHFQSFGLPVIRPNSMNNYGLILNEIGYDKFLTELCQRYVIPLVKKLFPPEYAQLDSHHAFIVQYKLTEDKDLNFHYDDSEITLNVCLGKDFIGGDLFFQGHVDDESTHEEDFRYQHRRGRAVLHIGKHYHGAYPIVSGERYNIIIWYRNSQIRGN